MSHYCIDIQKQFINFFTFWMEPIMMTVIFVVELKVCIFLSVFTFLVFVDQLDLVKKLDVACMKQVGVFSFCDSFSKAIFGFKNHNI